jgi:hypothetical protein
MQALMAAVLILIQPSPLDLAVDGGNVVLNEFMATPTESATHIEGEWIELYNVSSCYVNLSGWTITNDHGDEITINTHLVAPEGYFVLGSSGNEYRNGGYQPDLVYSGFEIHGYDRLTLRNASGSVVDMIDYDGAWQMQSGHSCERLNPGWVSNTSGSWAPAVSSFGDGDYGTPGELNSVYENSFAQNSWAFIKAFTL